jgi:acyl dehydratase
MTPPPRIGDALGPLTVERVDTEAMKRLAVLLADPNPIHLDAGAARRAGLGDRVVMQGPASVGYLIDMLLAAVPRGVIRELRVRFTASVHGGDRVSAAGRVNEVRDERGRQVLGCEVWLDVEGASRALEGTATLVVPDPDTET